MNHDWQECADEFGRLTKQGKDVRLALLVACAVEKQPLGNQPKGTNVPLKTSGNEFARRSGVPRQRVLRHLAAWDEFAEKVGLPLAAELAPGDAWTLEITEEQAAVFGTLRLTPTSTTPTRQTEAGAAARALNEAPEKAAEQLVEDLTPNAAMALEKALDKHYEARGAQTERGMRERGAGARAAKDALDEEVEVLTVCMKISDWARDGKQNWIKRVREHIDNLIFEGVADDLEPGMFTEDQPDKGSAE